MNVKPKTAPLTERPLLGRTVLVTGASRGIGKALAVRAAEAGANVAITARSQNDLASVAKQVKTSEVECLPVTCDVRSDESVASMLEQVKSALGHPDIVINNAGIYVTAPVRGHSLVTWNDVLTSNLTSAFLVSRIVLDNMIEKRWGRIINISSVSGKVAEIYGAAYSASKFGLIGFTQALALEVASYGITVNAICPGWVNTEMASKQLSDETWCQLNNLDPKEAASLSQMAVPQMRFIEPSEVADLAVFLASDKAQAITGQAINICGGLSLH
jgi:ketoreductase